MSSADTKPKPQEREQAFAQLLQEARRLRDYLLRAGTKAGQKLVAALAPFERSDGMTPGDDDVQKLYVSFQSAYEEAASEIDLYTINEVIGGRSPYRPLTLRSILGTSALTAFGILLIVIALSYSFWVNRAVHTLNRVERFAEFDHFAQVMQLVEFERFFDQTPDGQDARDLEPFQMYLEDIGSLNLHYQDEQKLPVDILDLTQQSEPLSYLKSGIVDAICPDPFTEQNPGMLLSWLCPSVPQWWTDARDAARTKAPGEADDTVPDATVASSQKAATLAPAQIAGTADDSQGIAAVMPLPPGKYLRNSVDSVWDLRNEIMSYAGRDSLINVEYRRSRQGILNSSEDLLGKLDNVQRVWLPLVYGFLGSIVYCMWRVLSAGIVSYSASYTAMRTAFAGLAALTLTMILVPSNSLSLGAATSHPLIYLVSFIFGYSIEAFVSTLNNLNRFLASSLAPKDRSGGK